MEWRAGRRKLLGEVVEIPWSPLEEGGYHAGEEELLKMLRIAAGSPEG